MGTITKFPGITQDNNRSRLDDPRYDPVARQLHLARHLRLPVYGTELDYLCVEVDQVLDYLAGLPDDEAMGEKLVMVTSALLGVQEFLEKLADKFDAADAESTQ